MTENTEQHCTILVVDDDQDVTDVIERAFALEDPEGEKFSVLTANNIEEALKLLETNNINQLWLDNRMPGENGIDFARRIQNNPTAYPFVKKISIVLISGTIKQDLAPDDKSLFVGMLPKPFDLDEIITFASKLHAGIQQKEEQKPQHPPVRFSSNPTRLCFQVFYQPISRAA